MLLNFRGGGAGFCQAFMHAGYGVIRLCLGTRSIESQDDRRHRCGTGGGWHSDKSATIELV